MIEVFRYCLNSVLNADPIVAPRMATRPFIEAANGQIIKGSGRAVSESLLGGADQVIQGFTGEQISYLRDLISLGTIATSPGNRNRHWLDALIANRLVKSSDDGRGRLEFAITALGRAAVAQLL
jgi:hypothetical protein